MKKFLAVSSLENVEITKAMPILLLKDRKLRKMPPWTQSLSSPKPYLNSEAQASFYLQAKTKHVLHVSYFIRTNLKISGLWSQDVDISPSSSVNSNIKPRQG